MNLAIFRRRRGWRTPIPGEEVYLHPPSISGNINQLSWKLAWRKVMIAAFIFILQEFVKKYDTVDYFADIRKK